MRTYERFFWVLPVYEKLVVFRNEPTPQFSDVPCFKTKSSWKPPNGHSAIEIFLSKAENDLYDIC